MPLAYLFGVFCPTRSSLNCETFEKGGLGLERDELEGESLEEKISFPAEKDLSLFSDSLTKGSGEKLNACYQCRKCSGGCPIAFAMDILPHQVIRLVQYGLEEMVLSSKTIWLCAACETCVTRCPNEIDIAKIMDNLRQRAEKAGINLGERKASIFHDAFLSSIKKRGRVYELGMIQKYTTKTGDFINRIKSGELIKDAKLGWNMFKRGKLRIFPQKVKGLKEIKNLFK